MNSFKNSYQNAKLFTQIYLDRKFKRHFENVVAHPQSKVVDGKTEVTQSLRICLQNTSKIIEILWLRLAKGAVYCASIISYIADLAVAHTPIEFKGEGDGRSPLKVD